MVIDRRRVLLCLILLFVFALGIAPTSGAGPHTARILVKLPEGNSAAATRLAAILGGQVVDRVAPLDLWVVEAPGAGAVLASRAAHTSGVAWAEPDGVAWIAGAMTAPRSPASGDSARVPDDPRLGEQWHHAQIGSRSAWGRALAEGTVIAVVDTGVDCAHPDLAAACLPGRDFVNDDDDARDDNRHGTIEAGVAAAVTNNGVGVAGMGWGARILPVKVMDEGGSGQLSDIVAGIVWAADHGADVINLSLGTMQMSNALRDAARHAYGKGVVLAAAAGNQGPGQPMYPAAYPEVLGVGATSQDDRVTTFSQSGPHVDLVAPGQRILTTDLGGGYASYDGTSEATPLVAGTAALLLGQEPARSPAEVMQLLLDTSVDLGPAGRDDDFGFGRLDAAAALARGAATVVQPVLLPWAWR